MGYFLFPTRKNKGFGARNEQDFQKWSQETAYQRPFLPTHYFNYQFGNLWKIRGNYMIKEEFRALTECAWTRSPKFRIRSEQGQMSN